jgi:phosphoglycolate phosphatase
LNLVPSRLNEAPGLPFRVFIFDFDGTLCNSFETSLRILDDLSQRHGFRRIPPDELEALRFQPLHRIIRGLGVPAYKLPWLVRDARLAMAARLHELQPFDGLGDILCELGRRGARRWIVTSNSATNVRTFVQRNGLSIDQVFGGAGLFGKGLTLRRSMTRLGAGEKAIYIGDEMRDIEAARAAGIPSGVVSWGFNTVESMMPLKPDFIFRAPADILELADRAVMGEEP